MNINSIKTDLITSKNNDVINIIDRGIQNLGERSIVALTSKIVSITQRRVVKKKLVSKNKLIEKEADFFISPDNTNHDFYLTIKNNILIPNAGIDESNAGEYYILWPNKPQQVANKIRLFLKKKFMLQQVGVLITDSTTAPLRWGVRGISIAHSGFSALNNYIGRPDIFGRKFKVTKANTADALAAAAVLEMGEGAEQTPLAVITDIPYVKFQNRNPTKKELDDFKISIDDDIFAPILKAAKWKKSSY